LLLLFTKFYLTGIKIVTVTAGGESVTLQAVLVIQVVFIYI
jgi:hypothetical protein